MSVKNIGHPVINTFGPPKGKARKKKRRIIRTFSIVGAIPVPTRKVKAVQVSAFQQLLNERNAQVISLKKELNFYKNLKDKLSGNIDAVIGRIMKLSDESDQGGTLPIAFDGTDETMSLVAKAEALTDKIQCMQKSKKGLVQIRDAVGLLVDTNLKEVSQENAFKIIDELNVIKKNLSQLIQIRKEFNSLNVRKAFVIAEKCAGQFKELTSKIPEKLGSKDFEVVIEGYHERMESLDKNIGMKVQQVSKSTEKLIKIVEDLQKVFGKKNSKRFVWDVTLSETHSSSSEETTSDSEGL